jgi:hypothetical protein
MITNHISLEGSRRALSNYISHSFIWSLDRRQIEQQQHYTHLHTSSSPSSCSDHPLQHNCLEIRLVMRKYSRIFEGTSCLYNMSPLHVLSLMWPKLLSADGGPWPLTLLSVTDVRILQNWNFWRTFSKFGRKLSRNLPSNQLSKRPVFTPSIHRLCYSK